VARGRPSCVCVARRACASPCRCVWVAVRLPCVVRRRECARRRVATPCARRSSVRRRSSPFVCATLRRSSVRRSCRSCRSCVCRVSVRRVRVRRRASVSVARRASCVSLTGGTGSPCVRRCVGASCVCPFARRRSFAVSVRRRVGACRSPCARRVGALAVSPRAPCVAVRVALRGSCVAVCRRAVPLVALRPSRATRVRPSCSSSDTTEPRHSALGALGSEARRAVLDGHQVSPVKFPDAQPSRCYQLRLRLGLAGDNDYVSVATVPRRTAYPYLNGVAVGYHRARRSLHHGYRSVRVHLHPPSPFSGGVLPTNATLATFMRQVKHPRTPPERCAVPAVPCRRRTGGTGSPVSPTLARRVGSLALPGGLRSPCAVWSVRRAPPRARRPTLLRPPCGRPPVVACDEPETRTPPARTSHGWHGRGCLTSDGERPIVRVWGERPEKRRQI